MSKIKLLHISSEENIDSIFENGILRKKPSLENHHEAFKEIDNYDGRVSYFLEPKSRWIKDFVYWKHWGTPRNKVFKNLTDRNLEYDDKLAKKIKLTPKRSVVIECAIEEDYIPNTNFVHVQDDNDPGYGEMDTRYIHDDMPLLVTIKGKVSPNGMRVVGFCEPLINNRGRIDMLLRW